MGLRQKFKTYSDNVFLSFKLKENLATHFWYAPFQPKQTVCLVDFLDKAGAEINFDNGKLSLVENNETPYACGIMSTKHAALIVFPKDRQESDKPLQKHKEQVRVGVFWTTLLWTSPHRTVRHGLSKLHKTNNPAEMSTRGYGQVRLGKKIPPLVCIEPAAIPI